MTDKKIVLRGGKHHGETFEVGEDILSVTYQRVAGKKEEILPDDPRLKPYKYYSTAVIEDGAEVFEIE